MAVTTRPASTETIKNFNVTKKPCWMDGWIVDERKSGSEIVAQETGQPMNGLSEIKYHINSGEEHYFSVGGNALMRSEQSPNTLP